jgi:hypothetical protein
MQHTNRTQVLNSNLKHCHIGQCPALNGGWLIHKQTAKICFATLEGNI